MRSIVMRRLSADPGEIDRAARRFAQTAASQLGRTSENGLREAEKVDRQALSAANAKSSKETTVV